MGHEESFRLLRVAAGLASISAKTRSSATSTAFDTARGVGGIGPMLKTASRKRSSRRARPHGDDNQRRSRLDCLRRGSLAQTGEFAD